MTIAAKEERPRVRAYLAALGFISLVSRLPQLLSPNLLLDGDECTLGLMARHLAQLKEFPIFFYGQHYGFSSVEAAAGALPLKLSMLALWTTGVLFLFLAQSRRGVRRVFSMNGLLQWQLMFYSNEDVLARSTWASDRYPAYVSAVDGALADGETVAVVGYTDRSGAPGCEAVPACTAAMERLVPNPEAIFTVDDKYFVYVGADRALIEKLGFRF